ncbi:MAG: protein-glutamate O-methyltransferase CheR [Magnetococcales bacterium]|nr:protein-glutamate O-methyltransferase CheR [Magnetococcales bacterium]MBF0156878.1 protein-glutamate O-methyltransferase CheR [Magnetococcales bacterium]
MSDAGTLEEVEIRLLLEALRLRFGYDFRQYAADSLRRLIRGYLASTPWRHVSEIIPHLLHDGCVRNELIGALTVNTTGMFRDPGVFRFLARELFPLLATYPFVNIWHAGCSTGEEVYSLAILLQEAGLYDRCRIYATDLNPEALEAARAGVYPVGRLPEYAGAYVEAGGRGSFSDHYHARYDYFRLDPALRANVLFSTHNLATDAVFVETHLIFCRNVLIYFDRALQDRVLGLFLESLVEGGFLCLGSRESLLFSVIDEAMASVSGPERIYRREFTDRSGRGEDRKPRRQVRRAALPSGANDPGQDPWSSPGRPCPSAS